MVIGPIHPGTLSPLTVSIRVFASTFSTAPRNVCSFFSFSCAELGLDEALEAGAVPGLALGRVLGGCCASALAIPENEMVLPECAAGQTKNQIKTRTLAGV